MCNWLVSQRAASAAGEAGSQEEEPPSWCVLCAGRQGDYGDFIHAVEAHGGGGQASVVLFHRSAGTSLGPRLRQTRTGRLGQYQECLVREWVCVCVREREM